MQSLLIEALRLPQSERVCENPLVTDYKTMMAWRAVWMPLKKAETKGALELFLLSCTIHKGQETLILEDNGFNYSVGPETQG